jgi:regulator of RNase E activity RraA
MLLVGRAMPVLETDYYAPADSTSQNAALNQSFGLMLDALDDLKPHEIYVCGGASPRYALWGELMSTRAQQLGAAGAVLDGYIRDTHGILALNFPTFGYGSYAQDQAPRGKVIDYRVPLMIANVRINPGDVLFGDIDGVCVVPAVAVEEAFTGAFEKARGEKRVKAAIEAGMSAREAFAKYGIF